MFTALKKLVSNENTSPNAFGGTSGSLGGSMATGHQPTAIDRNLQRMFAKGVHYNMKIVIKGDRNVGKTCLWRRLQGGKFEQEYVPTDEIQACHIQWSYKATDDIVKVEIWDVVDKGRKRKPLEGLKLTTASAVNVPDLTGTALDAEFVDVYKGTNGVIMMLDMTKAWTFEYVQRELPKVPRHIPVLVLNNHLDMKHHRAITEDQVRFFIEGLERTEAPVRYAESSMSNGFGLRFLHKFFNVPFLQLQREALLGHLERNRCEMSATCEELDLLLESDESNYDLFVDRLGQHRRFVADNCANIAMVPGAAPGKITGGGVLPARLPKSVSLPAEITNTILHKKGPNIHTPCSATSGKKHIHPNTQVAPAKTESKHFSERKSIRAQQQRQHHLHKEQLDDKSGCIRNSGTLPYGDGADVSADLNRFLDADDDDSVKVSAAATGGGTRPATQMGFTNADGSNSDDNEDDEDDGATGNPLVCGFQDDLDPEDLECFAYGSRKGLIQTNGSHESEIVVASKLGPFLVSEASTKDDLAVSVNHKPARPTSPNLSQASREPCYRTESATFSNNECERDLTKTALACWNGTILQPTAAPLATDSGGSGCKDGVDRCSNRASDVNETGFLLGVALAQHDSPVLADAAASEAQHSAIADASATLHSTQPSPLSFDQPSERRVLTAGISQSQCGDDYGDNEDIGDHQTSPVLRFEREDPDGTSSPAEWNHPDLDERERSSFAVDSQRRAGAANADGLSILHHNNSTYNNKENTKKHKKLSSKKGRKDKTLTAKLTFAEDSVSKNSEASSGDPVTTTVSKKKKKSSSSKKHRPTDEKVLSDVSAYDVQNSLSAGNDLLEAFLNDRSQYEAL